MNSGGQPQPEVRYWAEEKANGGQPTYYCTIKTAEFEMASWGNSSNGMEAIERGVGSILGLIEAAADAQIPRINGPAETLPNLRPLNKEEEERVLAVLRGEALP